MEVETNQKFEFLLILEIYQNIEHKMSVKSVR